MERDQLPHLMVARPVVAHLGYLRSRYELFHRTVGSRVDLSLNHRKRLRLAVLVNDHKLTSNDQLANVL